MRKHIAAILGLGLGAACAGDAATGPVAAASQANTSYYPGSRRTDAAKTGTFVPLNCTPRLTSEGSALIGPAGGVLRIGTHRLIVPAGALTEPVLISGTVPAGKPFEIELLPHGLQFRKAAGLILSTASCTDVPAIVYLIDQSTTSEPIPAFYSNWWKAIASPIWHFSGYAVAFRDGEGVEDDAASAK
jgi:hypothetical protein